MRFLFVIVAIVASLGAVLPSEAMATDKQATAAAPASAEAIKPAAAPSAPADAGKPDVAKPVAVLSAPADGIKGKPPEANDALKVCVARFGKNAKGQADHDAVATCMKANGIGAAATKPAVVPPVVPVAGAAH